MEYPREYRLRRGWRHLFMALCLLLAVAMLVIPVLAGRDETVAIGALWLICLPMVALGLVGAVSLQRAKVVLHADAIELHGLVKRQRLERAYILGRKLVRQPHGPPAIRLVADSRIARDLSVPQFLDEDAAFHDWMASLEDLDAHERTQSERSYLHGSQGDEGERREKMRHLHSATRVARGANVATLILGAWAWLHPYPYLLVTGLLAMVPIIIVIITVMGKGAYSLEGRDNDVRANIAVPFFMPGLVLMARALLDITVFDWTRLMWLATGAAAVCMLLLLWAVRELRKRSWVAFFLPLLTLPYCYGALSVANLHFDVSEPQVFSTRVLAMHASSGKTVTRYLNVEPWGPVKFAEDIEVDEELYERVRRGDTVCVYLFSGALEVRWLDVWNCPV